MYETNNTTSLNSNVTGDNNVSNSMVQTKMGGCSGPVQEKCIHRTFIHEVPHVCPIHTRIINHHVYKHTYCPKYTCSEENTVSNIQCGSCQQFR